MRKPIFFLCLIVGIIFSCATLFADDAGVEIPPTVYAAQESAASAKNYGHTLCYQAQYACRAVGPHDTWYSLFPNFQQREEVMRLNRTNVALMYRNWIVVPKDFSKTTYMDMSPLPSHLDTQGKKILYINLKLFAFGAYSTQGKLVYWGPVSSGRAKCFASNRSCATSVGRFRVFRIGDKNCASKEYPLETHGGAPMPYCMYFHNGEAFHSSTLSGFINRSSGCVRMFHADAKWLNHKFVQLGTEVIVKQ